MVCDLGHKIFLDTFWYDTVNENDMGVVVKIRIQRVQEFRDLMELRRKMRLQIGSARSSETIFEKTVIRGSGVSKECITQWQFNFVHKTI